MASEYRNMIGKKATIKKGICGEGYTFIVARVLESERGPQVWGHNYGPVRLSEVDLTS